MHLLEDHVDGKSIEEDQIGNENAVDKTWNLIKIAAP